MGAFFNLPPTRMIFSSSKNGFKVTNLFSRFNGFLFSNLEIVSKYSSRCSSRIIILVDLDSSPVVKVPLSFSRFCLKLFKYRSTYAKHLLKRSKDENFLTTSVKNVLSICIGNAICLFNSSLVSYVSETILDLSKFSSQSGPKWAN